MLWTDYVKSQEDVTLFRNSAQSAPSCMPCEALQRGSGDGWHPTIPWSSSSWPTFPFWPKSFAVRCPEVLSAVVDTLKRDFDEHYFSNCDPWCITFAQPLLVWRVPRRFPVSYAQAARSARTEVSTFA
jgi:hypothetical protein